MHPVYTAEGKIMIRKLAAALAITLAAAMPAIAEPVKFAVTDIEGLEALQQEFGAFEAALEEATGLEIELYPVASRTTAVEALNASQVDLVLTGPAESSSLGSVRTILRRLPCSLTDRSARSKI
jgi:ABC-type phosphate/phosphonate transport system substrate-binding protein